MRDAAPLPFHIVTGFLGAGKTTLINRLLRAPELADALVMVNEWGEIGLDHLLYERLSGDAILISGGCVCCALRGDLVDALRDVLSRRDEGTLPAFGRIVLETTGLAEPAPILHAMLADPELAARLAFAGVTTVVDAVNGVATAGRPESARQIALADRLVAAKTDLVPAPERAARFAELAAALKNLNPVAPILDGAAGEFSPGDFLAVSAAPPPAASMGASGGAHGVRTFVFRSEAPIEPAAFAQFLTALGAMLGPRLLRLKGLFALADRPDTPNSGRRRSARVSPAEDARALAGRGPVDARRADRRGRRGARGGHPLGRADPRPAHRLARPRRARRQSARAAAGRAARIGRGRRARLTRRK